MRDYTPTPTPAVARTQEQRDNDVEALANFAEECAKPIATLASFMTDGLGPFWLVLHALEAAAREYAAGAVKPEALEDFDRAAARAAERIVAGWHRSEANLEFRAALGRATQKGGAA